MGKMVNMTKASFGVLFTFTVLSFLFLSTNSTSASNTAVSDIYVTVPISCNIITTLDSPHTATINPGQAVENIGTTTFNVFCNDNAGYAIYAIGYSNEEYGNTDMIATVGGTLSPSNDIATGLTTSGTSSWSMKLNAVTGTYAPTIVTGFDAYHVVPSTYTKVAYLASSTDYNTGSSLQSTYKGYISSNQPSGTYNGKVKYTIVHPNNADAPTLPVTCDSNKICYNPNASGAIDAMGDQSITNSATSATLWASNFQRSGYGFAGWSDKNDWVINLNNANNEGINENAGYHIYGPNQTIEFTRGQYSGSNPGLALYAVWVPSAGNLQGWTGCSGLSIGQVTALTDTRDNNTYAVAKLVDGNCWMIENLRLADQTISGTTTTLTMANTNNPANDGNGSVTITNVNSSGSIVSPATNHLSVSIDPSITAWCTASVSSDCINKSMLFSGNTTNPASPQMTTKDSLVYSYGNYYNWYSATAGNGTLNFSVANDSIDGDICPAGWRLPRGGGSSNAVNSEFRQLTTIIAGPEIEIIAGGQVENVSTIFRSFPNNFIYSSNVYGSSINSRGVTGYYWSSTTESSYNAFCLILGSTSVAPGSGAWNKYYGNSVRCVAGS